MAKVLSVCFSSVFTSKAYLQESQGSETSGKAWSNKDSSSGGESGKPFPNMKDKKVMGVVSMDSQRGNHVLPT